MDQTQNPHERMVLYEKDPLLKFLRDRLNLPLPVIVSLAVALAAMIFFGAGVVASYLVHKAANIIRALDPEYLYLSLVVAFVNVPLIWILYVWQPTGIANTLDSLRQEDVTVETEEGGLDAFTQTMKANLDSSRLSIGAAFAVLVIVLIQTFIVYPAESRQLGTPFFWFYDKRYYFLLHTPILFFNYYAGAMVALKGILALFWFNLLFRRFQAKVHPLHPDGAGGLGALGSLAVKYGLIAVALGAMAATITVVRILIGSGWAYIDHLLLYALYIILTPVSLITPLWSAHHAMVHARDELLHDISNEFEKILTQETLQDIEALSEQRLGELKARYTVVRDTHVFKSSELEEIVIQEEPKHIEALKESGEKLVELKARHALIKETYPTWPISLALFRKFSVTASLPLVTGILSIAVEVTTR
jgi:hypothetical protein